MVAGAGIRHDRPQMEGLVMATYTGTTHVTPGMYLNLRRRTITHIETEGPLPGGERDRYYRVPMILMLAAAPLLGLAFVIFLPFIGFAMVAKLVGDLLLDAFARVITAAMRVVRPGWVPTMAFLARAKPRRRHRARATDDEWSRKTERTLRGRDKHAR